MTMSQTTDLKRNLKNFTFKANGVYDNDYAQYLCRFKDSVTIDEINNFCSYINNSLPRNFSDTFMNACESDVIDFSPIVSSIESKYFDRNLAIRTITTFLNMFEFGNYRVKSVDHASCDKASSLYGVFGNVDKSKRLFKEIQSATPNTIIMNLVGPSVVINNYVGDLKTKEVSIKKNIKK